MKLFVTDIDDTLSVGEIVSEKVQNACKRLRDAGWEIMIATGRTYGTAKVHIKAAGATQPAILYDGSRIMSLEGQEIHSSLFEPSLTRELLEFLWALPVEIQIADDEFIHCREGDRETVDFYRKAGVRIHYVSAPHTTAPVYRIGLWIRPDLLPSIERTLTIHFGDQAEVVSGGPQFLDLLPKGVSKGAALEFYLSDLPQRPELVVAAGDHKNDLTMLQIADVAAVPRNAVPELLSLADIIMPEALEDGVEALITHVLSPAFQTNKTDSPLLLY